MTKMRIVVLSVLLLSVLYSPSCVPAQSPKSIGLKVILDMHAGTEKYITPSSAQVNVSRSTSASGPGIDITIQPGKEGYPGVNIKSEGAAWNLALPARSPRYSDIPMDVNLVMRSSRTRS